MFRPLPFLACGVILLVTSAFEPSCSRRVPARVALLVDVSPSTRGAWWRSPERLMEFAERFGNVSIVPFADGGRAVTLDSYTGQTIAVDQTIITPPVEADIAVVLTDGQLTMLDAAMPLVLVSDPALDSPADNFVHRLEVEGDAIIVVGSGSLAVDGQAIDGAAIRMNRTEDSAAMASALDSDRWPENDSLELLGGPSASGSRLTMGLPTPRGFTNFSLAALPSAAVVMIGDSEEISPAVADALSTYVQQNAGALIYTGVDPPPEIEALLPISFTPPAPQGRWIALIDTSGSMAQRGADARSRADDAAAATLRAIGELPPGTPVDVATFADALTWQSRGQAAEDVRVLSLAMNPGGRTNLAAALIDAVGQAAGTPVNVLVITDAETPDAATALPALRAAAARVHVLHVGEQVDVALQRIVDATGGRLIRAADPIDWADGAADLVRSAVRPAAQTSSRVLRFGDLTMAVSPWSRAWVRDDAISVADDGDGPAAATWWVGGGRVMALSGVIAPDDLAALADEMVVEPNSAIAVSWRDGPTLSVEVEVAGASSVRLRRGDQIVDAHRTGPATWKASIAGKRESAVAVVEVDGQPVAQQPTAERYTFEFESIGNEPKTDFTDANSLDIPLIERRRSMTLMFALAGALAMLAAALDMAGVKIGRDRNWRYLWQR